MSSSPPATFEPHISIVIAVRNGAETMQRCLDSVFAQEPGLAEIVVADGASTDGTVAILERNAKSLASWTSEPDHGICDAWNKSLSRVSGEWVLFLGADDQLASTEVLARASEALRRLDISRLVAYGRVDVIGSGGTVIARPGRPWPEAKRGFAAYNTIPHQGVFHRRRLFDVVGRFDERFRILGDYELLIRAFKVSEPVFIDMVIAEYSGEGLSGQPGNMLAATREAYKARYVNGLERFPEWASFRVYRAFAFEVVRRTIGLGVARRLADRYHGRRDEPPAWGPPTD